MGGHGLAAGRDIAASYTCPEYGTILGIFSVIPRTAYHQGVPRTWLKGTRYDYYHPEFAHLSEQAVLNGEIYAGAVAGTNTTVFGYQARFNEMRYIPSRVAGLMRPNVTGSLSYWNLARDFAALPGLNAAFMKCIPRKDYLAAPTQPAMIVNIGNLIKAVRPLPVEADPGLIDHS